MPFLHLYPPYLAVPSSLVGMHILLQLHAMPAHMCLWMGFPTLSPSSPQDCHLCPACLALPIPLCHTLPAFITPPSMAPNSSVPPPAPPPSCPAHPYLPACLWGWWFPAFCLAFLMHDLGPCCLPTCPTWEDGMPTCSSPFVLVALAPFALAIPCLL